MSMDFRLGYGLESAKLFQELWRCCFLQPSEAEILYCFNKLMHPTCILTELRRMFRHSQKRPSLMLRASGDVEHSADELIAEAYLRGKSHELIVYPVVYLG